MLVHILMGISFVSFIIGLGGLVGTVEQTITNPQGVVLSTLILVVGIASGLLAAKEDGYFRNKK